MLKKRSEIWREEYHNRRYLEHLSDGELSQRLIDVLTNLFVLYENGKIGFRHIEKGGGYWIRLFTHIQEEYSLRGKAIPPDAFRKAHLPKATYPGKPKSYEAVEGKSFDDKKYLVKYGKIKFLVPLYENGTVRIFPASSYKDPSLNPAIQDDELTLTTFGLPSEFTMEVIDGKTGEKKGPIKPIGNIKFAATCPTDYYVYCLSYVYEHRLFGDFEADGCLIIINPEEFLGRMSAEIKKILPDWINFSSGIEYIDPLRRPVKEELIIFFSKHFRYAYQQEFRFVSLPPPGKFEPLLKEIDLNLGSLNGIAQLIDLR